MPGLNEQKFDYWLNTSQICRIERMNVSFIFYIQTKMQTLLTDPNIQSFMEQIPPNQQLVTLKQLLYIGIKIVNNSFEQTQNLNFQPPTFKQKENQINQLNYQESQPERDRVFKKKSKATFIRQSEKPENRVEPSLLREISKIRMQLEDLTNKVYDQCFLEGGQQSESQSQESDFSEEEQISFENREQKKSQRPQKIEQPPKNAFSKQRNNFFVTEAVQRNQRSAQQSREKVSESRNTQQFEQRNRAKSSVMHLDDTQVRQALYKDADQSEDDFEAEVAQQSRFKKSRSMIEKRMQQKKRSQQNYFHELAIEKQRVAELNAVKNNFHQAERDNGPRNSTKKVAKTNAYRKKAKSKIKQLVQRDRLRHQEKMEEENYRKGFEQYEYSANEFEDDEEQDYEEDEQNNEQILNQGRSSQAPFREQESSQGNLLRNSPEQVQYSEEESYQQEADRPQQRHGSRSENPNFGFYNSEEPIERRQKRSSNKKQIAERSVEQHDNINACSDSSSFSEFSISGSSRRRAVGKISRRE